MPILVNDELVGNVSDVNEVQLLNTIAPILVTEFGIISDVNALQFWNALVPIVVTLFPILTFIK